MRGIATWMRCATVTSCLAVAIVAPPQAAAAPVTIGQVGAASGSCSANFDWVPLSVAGGASYTAPGAGTITSWSTGGMEPGDELTMKVWRNTGGVTYQVVGRDGPRPIASGGPSANIFPASVAVKAGDLLGFNVGAFSGNCTIAATPADTHRVRPGNLATGDSGTFTAPLPERLNISASFTYDNQFTLAKTTRNRKKGTAMLTFELPNPGRLTVSGSGAKVVASRLDAAVPAGQTNVVVKATGKKRKRLNENGKVKLSLDITYTPTGGDPKGGEQPVKLKKG